MFYHKKHKQHIFNARSLRCVGQPAWNFARSVLGPVL